MQCKTAHDHDDPYPGIEGHWIRKLNSKGARALAAFHDVFHICFQTMPPTFNVA
jgi:hypothetical protein